MADIEARDIERVWREKSDDELIEAAAQLGDFTPEGQRVIREELKRRGLEDPVEQAGGVALEADPDAAPPRECTQCHSELRYIGLRDINPELGPLRELRNLFQDQPLDVYVCPQCGHVDFFVNISEAGESEEPGEAEEA